MRTYLIFKEKAEQFNKDKEIQALLAEINSGGEKWRWLSGSYSKDKVKRLINEPFDREKLGARGLKYERLDQLTTELLLGVR
jgi:xylose isomerase